MLPPKQLGQSRSFSYIERQQICEKLLPQLPENAVLSGLFLPGRVLKDGGDYNAAVVDSACQTMR